MDFNGFSTLCLLGGMRGGVDLEVDLRLVCFKAVLTRLFLWLKSARKWVLTVQTVPATHGGDFMGNPLLLQINPARQEFRYMYLKGG